MTEPSETDSNGMCFPQETSVLEDPNLSQTLGEEARGQLSLSAADASAQLALDDAFQRGANEPPVLSSQQQLLVSQREQSLSPDQTRLDSTNAQFLRELMMRFNLQSGNDGSLDEAAFRRIQEKLMQVSNHRPLPLCARKLILSLQALQDETDHFESV